MRVSKPQVDFVLIKDKFYLGKIEIFIKILTVCHSNWALQKLKECQNLFEEMVL